MGKKIDDGEYGALFPEKEIPRVPPPPKAAPDGKTLVCRPYITLKNGKRLFAASYGKQAFCFYVDA